MVCSPTCVCHLVSALQLGGVGGRSPGSTDPKGQGWVPPSLPVAQTRQEAAWGLPEASLLGGASRGPSSEAMATLRVCTPVGPSLAPLLCLAGLYTPHPPAAPSAQPLPEAPQPLCAHLESSHPSLLWHPSGQVGGVLRPGPGLSTTPGFCTLRLGRDATGVSPWDLLLRLAACSVGLLLQTGR